MRKKAPEFKDFWDAYGLKRDRYAAEAAWKRLSAKDKASAVAGIEAYREDCRKRGISMMYGQGYLNHHRWEDETEEQSVQPKEVPPSPALSALEDMETW